MDYRSKIDEKVERMTITEQSVDSLEMVIGSLRRLDENGSRY